MNHFILFIASILSVASCALAFVTPVSSSVGAVQRYTSTSLEMSDVDDVVASSTQDKIQALVDDNPVLLFMKGSKLFPQCGFSNSACQILQSYNIDFATVDILADEELRQGVKVYSQWP